MSASASASESASASVSVSTSASVSEFYTCVRVRFRVRVRVRVRFRVLQSAVRSILIYNCSTWSSNKGVRDRIDIIHRKHMRRSLNIHYPKTISNQKLYSITNSVPISEFVDKRRKAHLGHVLRRETTVKDIYKHIWTLPKRRGKRGAKPANIFKTYRKDHETDDIHALEEKAFARTL